MWAFAIESNWEGTHRGHSYAALLAVHHLTEPILTGQSDGSEPYRLVQNFMERCP